ncbi:hypothetical protein HZS_4918, partial [Henneguya salminicola]
MFRNFGCLKSIIFSTLEISDNKIILIGKKEIALNCEKYLYDRINELSKSVAQSIPISETLVPILKGAGDAILKADLDDAGWDIHIQLPKNISTNEKSAMLGPSLADVKKVKISISEKIKFLKDTIEKTIEIKEKRGENPTLVQKLSTEHDRIAGSENFKVIIKGYKDDVENLIAAINSLVLKLDGRVDKSVTFKIEDLNTILKTVMPRPFQRSALNVRGKYFISLVQDCMIDINMGYTRTSPEDECVVTGLKENVDKAVKWIEQLRDENYVYHIEAPEKYLTRLIRTKETFIKKFSSDNNVRVLIPSDVNEQSYI